MDWGTEPPGARAYTFTPYWNETADPALRKVLESVILDPNADVKGLLTQAAKDAQAALDKIRKINTYPLLSKSDM
jgi:hypothetical protein